MSHSTADSPVNPHTSPWYLSAMERLVGVVQELSQAHDIDAVNAIVREAARALTGADGATFVLRDGDQCYYAEENAIGPLWKGRRFPMSSCISGWAMLNRQAAVIEDIYTDPRIPLDAYRPTFVKSLAMVPVRRAEPIAAIGNYWASRHLPTQEEVAVLQALADTTSVALENAELYGKLQRQVKTLEQQQAQIQEQHASLEIFTRALAHDLKEPVRTMRSFSRMSPANDVQKQQDYLRYVQAAADRMGMLIDTIFHYTQLDDPARITQEPCGMQEMLEGVKANLAQLIHERQAKILCDTLPQVQANPAQLMQLMQNLIANAIVHNEKPVTVRLEARDAGDFWRFCVSDDGVGIPEGQRETIFQPFKRLTHNEACAGLGLAICRKIVAFYGGKIWYESSPGKEASFFFTLPKAGGVAVSESTQRPTAQAPLQEGALATILLVDDRRADIELTRIALFDMTGLECNVQVAYDGEEAHRILQARQRANDPVDLVLLDVNMPRMDGFELMERLRQDETLKDVAVVMCTGSIYEPDRQRAESLGALGYLVKPPSLDMLKSLMPRLPRLWFRHDGKNEKLLRRVA